MRPRSTRSPFLLAFLLLATGCASLVPATPTTRPSISIPSCPANAGCGEGFAYEGVTYSVLCTEVRPGAVSTDVPIEGQGPFGQVRPIIGIPERLFLAVSGDDVPCGSGAAGRWWFARADGITESQLAEVRQRLIAVTAP